MRVVLDVQHQGRVSKPMDRGAYSQGFEEVELTRRYAGAADQELRRLGHQVFLLSDGEYRERWERADRYSADVYVACHVDAGGGDRGTVFFDHRSSRGKLLAQCIAQELGQTVAWPVEAKQAHPDTDGIRGNQGEGPYATIFGVRAVAVCYEPGFIDSRNVLYRQFLIGRAEDLGLALARGIDMWGRPEKRP